MFHLCRMFGSTWISRPQFTSRKPRACSHGKRCLPFLLGVLHIPKIYGHRNPQKQHGAGEQSDTSQLPKADCVVGNTRINDAPDAAGNKLDAHTCVTHPCSVSKCTA